MLVDRRLGKAMVVILPGPAQRTDGENLIARLLGNFPAERILFGLFLLEAAPGKHHPVTTPPAGKDSSFVIRCQPVDARPSLVDDAGQARSQLGCESVVRNENHPGD